jgi:ubiquinone/menaquinone biosynthesis C-methylase UbiE
VDKWKFFDVTHREHVLCNPMSIEKHEQLVELLRLKPGDRVLEIATGKGEFIVRLAERYGVSGIGVDLSPYCIADAQRKLSEHASDAQLSFIEMDGADFQLEEPESFALVACIGASWIFKGHQGTLEFLIRAVAPGGWVVVGEPYWRKEPTEDYLEALNESRSTYGSHYENVVAGEQLGLTLVYTLVSNLDDWDKYEGLQWYAAEQYARSHPEDPDVAEILARINESKAEYLKWGRDTLGWAIYVFRKPETV